LLTFLEGAQNVAKLLADLRTEVESTSTNLLCSRINPIYEDAAYNVLCSGTAVASSRGFVLFLIISIASTVIISLRASWYHEIEEEKVYQDENDIAENMILDEHEEYLAYISRFKHEWQEYRGFKSESMQDDEWEDDDEDDDYHDEDNSADLSYLSGSEGSMRNEPRTDGERSDDDGSDPTDLDHEDERQASHPTDPVAMVSIDTQDISFPSLKDPESANSLSLSDSDVVYLEPSFLLSPMHDTNDAMDLSLDATTIHRSNTARDPDGVKPEMMHPIFFRDDEEEDESESDVDLNHFSKQQSSVAESNEDDNTVAEGEGVEVALLSSIPAAVQQPPQSKGVAESKQAKKILFDQKIIRRSQRPQQLQPGEREDISVDSIYTSSSSIIVDLPQQQQRPRRLDPTPTAAIARVRSSSPAFQSLVEKFESRAARQSRLRLLKKGEKRSDHR
jgi:hypothetical protein